MPRTCLRAPSFHIEHYEKPFETTIQHQFFAPKIYTDNKVYVTDWDVFRLSEPKDRDPYKDGTSLFLSSYDRLGSFPGDRPMQSETTRMLQQINLKSQYKIEPATPMFNILTFFMSETEKKKKYLKMTNIVQLPANYGKGEYETENRSAFINYFQMDSKKEKELEKESEVNFFKYHKSLSELVDAASNKRPGWNKFLDDNLQHFYRFSRCRKR